MKYKLSFFGLAILTLGMLVSCNASVGIFWTSEHEQKIDSGDNGLAKDLFVWKVQKFKNKWWAQSNVFYTTDYATGSNPGYWSPQAPPDSMRLVNDSVVIGTTMYVVFAKDDNPGTVYSTSDGVAWTVATPSTIANAADLYADRVFNYDGNLVISVRSKSNTTEFRLFDNTQNTWFTFNGSTTISKPIGAVVWTNGGTARGFIFAGNGAWEQSPGHTTPGTSGSEVLTNQVSALSGFPTVAAVAVANGDFYAVTGMDANNTGGQGYIFKFTNASSTWSQSGQMNINSTAANFTSIIDISGHTGIDGNNQVTLAPGTANGYSSLLKNETLMVGSNNNGLWVIDTTSSVSARPLGAYDGNYYSAEELRQKRVWGFGGGAGTDPVFVGTVNSGLWSGFWTNSPPVGGNVGFTWRHD